jgi:hypothetical protein
VGAAKYVTVPAPETLATAENPAALSDTLFNAVKRLGVPRGRAREQSGLYF